MTYGSRAAVDAAVTAGALAVVTVGAAELRVGDVVLRQGRRWGPDGGHLWAGLGWPLTALGVHVDGAEPARVTVVWDGVPWASEYGGGDLLELARPQVAR